MRPISMLNNKKGVGIMEIIVSTVLLALVLAGLVNIFISGKAYVQHNRSKMAGGQLGKQFLDPLQMHVREDTWNLAVNKLSVIPPWKGDVVSVNNVKYTPTYTISKVTDAAGNDLGLRRVEVNINWPRSNP